MVQAIARAAVEGSVGDVLSVHPDGYSARGTVSTIPGSPARRSRWFRGAAGSPCRARRASRAVPDKTAAAADEVAAFLVRRGQRISRLADGHVTYHGSGRVVLPPLHPALRPSLRAGGRGGCVLHRLRDARADPDPRRGRQLSGGAGALRACRGCAGRSWGHRRRSAMPRTGPSISGTNPADGSGDVLYHLDPLWAHRRDRFRRHRQLHAAVGLAGRVRARGCGGRVRSTTSTISRRMSRAARDSTGIMPTRRDARPGAPADPRRRLWRALGVPLQGPGELVVAAACQPLRRGEGRGADGLGAEVEADLVHRARLPGRRQGHEPAERLLRPEIVGELPALLSRTGRATTSSSIAICRRSSRIGTIRRTTRCRTSMAGGWSTWSRAHVWAWDARPWPDFPARLETWVDGANHELGHWLNGRMSNVGARRCGGRDLRAVRTGRVDVARLYGTVTGYCIGRVAERAAEPAAADAGLWLRQLRRGWRAGLRQPGRHGRVGRASIATGSSSKGAIRRSPPRAARPPRPRGGSRSVSCGRPRLSERGGGGDRARRGGAEHGADRSCRSSCRAARRGRSPSAGLARRGSRGTPLAFALPPSAMALTPGDVVALAAAARPTSIVSTGSRTGGASARQRGADRAGGLRRARSIATLRPGRRGLHGADAGPCRCSWICRC